MSMGGSSFDDDDWNDIRKTTIVLVGRTGNGKSATGNTILGNRHFKSAKSQASVTATCQIASEIKDDGRCISVIDTPGLFDSTQPAEYLQREISKCIELARDGVHAVVLVLSTRNRFTLEEIAAVDNLRTIFGEKVLGYMIVLFTGGDELDDEGITLEEYLPSTADGPTPNELQGLLDKCSGRKLAFDNKTKDSRKIAEQTAQLLAMVDDVVESNGGRPYTNELFDQAQKLANTLAKEKMLEGILAKPSTERDAYAKEIFETWRKELEAAHSQQLKVVTEMVEEKLRSAAQRQQQLLEDRLEAEKLARQNAERMALEAASMASEEMEKLRRMLEEARQQREEMQRRFDSQVSKGCTIL